MIVTDDELQASLQTFINNALSPANGEVRVSVDNGVVTLAGRVASATQRRALRDLVAASDSVRHVLYAIEIGAPAAPQHA
jgi:osmotically-inducible protein OsmY